MRFGLILVAGGLVAASCGGGEPVAQTNELGARIYAENCSVCHEVDGSGRITDDGLRLGRPLGGVAERYTVEQQIEIVTFGGQVIGGSSMPAWGR
ncbi:MAG: cytochrome c, partial [Acidimicrobiales bacterium]